MIKIVFLDFDNTLYSHSTDSICDSAYLAIKKLQEKGIKVFLCTGRPYCELRFFDLAKYNFDGILASEGQIGFDKDDNIIYNNPITGKLKEEIIDRFNNKKLPMIISTERDFFANYIDETINNINSAIHTENPEVKEFTNENIYMCSVFHGKNEDEWNKIFELKDIADIAVWNPKAVDLIPKNSSKALGIDAIINKLDIKKEETMCFGDSYNDIEMIKYCEIGIAMGNSKDPVKQAADYITNDIDEDGIYNALKHFDLI